MLELLSQLLVLAEDAAPQDKGGSIWFILGPPLLLIFVMYYFMDPSRRKDQQRREQMLKELKKNDKVITIGGIIGSVVNVSTDGKEVTVKVDDNCRIRFRRTAIAEVFIDEPSEPAKSS
jgi:preprotein translocase subunit YajC